MYEEGEMYRVGQKIFETEEEARNFSRDLMSYGALGGWEKTDDPATHIYLGDLRTERITAGFDEGAYWEDPYVRDGWAQQDVIDMYRRER